MTTINANTKIGTIINGNKEALEAIIRISPRFEKLRNPILRKFIANRTSIAAASKIGGCSVEDFFKALEPLGIAIDRSVKLPEEKKGKVPEWINTISDKDIFDLDVRPVIEGGKDPLNIIMQKVKTIQPGQVLKIINSFEPTPLIQLLGKKGFETFVDEKPAGQFNTYFLRRMKPVNGGDVEVKVMRKADDWEHWLGHFENKLQEIDVRDLEMPKPMHMILDSIETLPQEEALFVYHKRVPVFLLPELDTRGFEYRIKDYGGGDVRMLIFRK